tara:strand:+ start:21511 stop:22341 length:831 start_codon:yes stop_codon:yes gene_type:complete
LPIRASIELLRPINGLITAGSVLLAAWLATGQLTLPAFIAAFSATLIAGFGNGHNDIVDVEVDRLAHPNRPLPASGISVHAARRVTWACALVGCVSAMALPPSCLAIAGVNTFGLWFYNRRAKWWPFFGNALIAAIAASTFIYGGFAVGSLRGIWPITMFAFTLHLSREIIKDLEDLGPDRERGGATLPGHLGVNVALWAASALLVLLILVTPFPALWSEHVEHPYLAAIAVLDILLLTILYRIWKSPLPERFSRASRLLKWATIVGLAAFCVLQR